MDAQAPLPEPKPDREGQLEFVFGPATRPDGTTPAGDEELRRMRAIAYHARKLADELGLSTVEPGEISCETSTDSAQAREIKALAQPQMDQAALEVRGVLYARRTEKHADGSEVAEEVIGFMKIRADVRGALKALKDVIPKGVRWSTRLCVKAGHWLRAQISVGNDAQSKNLDD